MEQKDLNLIAEHVGKETTAKIDAAIKPYETKVAELETLVKEQKGGITEDQFKVFKETSEAAVADVKEIARKQGLSLADVSAKLDQTKQGGKSIEEVLHENTKELADCFTNRQGGVEFMVTPKSDGSFTMARYNRANKTTGLEATINDLPSGATAAVSQNFTAAGLLRLAGDAQISSLYRNTQWLFDLVTVTQASPSQIQAVWFDELAVQGGAAVVAEGGTKPLTQYSYQLNNSTYKKVAQLVTFTEEFSMDFARLQADIMGKGRIDVLNLVNAGLLTDLTSAATAYNTSTSFKGGVVVPGANDFDVIAALSAQVDSATYGTMTNATIMSTFKKYRMGVLKSTQQEYLNRPDVLANVAFVGNPDMAADDVIAGDLKQMNLILRGGFILRIGYNGTDFAQNQFSAVMEQYYYDYIPTARKKAIVKGPDFATVKTAIGS